MAADQGAGFEQYRRATKRDVFLETMEQIVPWAQLCAVVEPYYPKGQGGRPSVGLERMLRTHFVQHWFNLADEACVLAMLKRSVEAAHAAADETRSPPPEVSTYYLAVQIRSQYEGMLIALPPDEWSCWSDATPDVIARKLPEWPAASIRPRYAYARVAPKPANLAPYVEGAIARAHHSTARLLKRAKGGSSWSRP